MSCFIPIHRDEASGEETTKAVRVLSRYIGTQDARIIIDGYIPNVEFRKTERNPDLSGNHNGGD